MDASLFQDVYDVLNSNKRKLVFPVTNGSPITKIIWSSFDYTVGPSLIFTWEPKYQEIFILDTGPLDDSSSDRITSTSSSKETQEGLNGLQYDESMHLSVITEPSTSIFVDETDGDKKHQEAEQQSGRTDESTLCATSYGNATICPENQINLAENYSDEDRSSYTSVSDIENDDDLEKCTGDQTNAALITSCVDSGLGATVSVHSDLSGRSSKLINPSNGTYQPIDETSSTNSDQSDYGCCQETSEENENDQNDVDDKNELLECLDEQATASFLNASSNVVGLSLLGAPLDEFNDTTDEKESRTFASLIDEDQTEHPGALDDEEFVVKMALSEAICCFQFDSSPVVKISIVPNRRLMIVSFLFSAKNDLKSMMAISILLNENAEDWYYAREEVFEEMFADIIPCFKANLLVSDESDTICRLTEDFLDMCNFWGALEKYPLLSSTSIWKTDLNTTCFMGENLELFDFNFLCKSITACLISQGHCVVIGNDGAIVDKLMITLSLFLPTKHKLLCIKPHQHPFSPYYRLQGLRRSDVEDLYLNSAASHWPMCFIDVDRKTVSTSGKYFVHRSRKETLQLHELGQILHTNLSAEEQVISRRPPIINPIPVEIEPYIERLFQLFFLLPDRIERVAFIDHMLTTLEYKANALIQTVKEVSEPSKNFKESAVSSKWSLSAVRKILGLESEALFGILIAQAQLISRSFPEFLYQSRRFAR
ncbi:hypothetical protein M3Y95_00566400 [Aphelenchoides besseyi]|nr:hypothetical protein M3Y95_00566400 [Aphelenchoides besseyi]